ncbi:GAF and ANTAR domain-containing protein [Umezawaea beigongshangensis]|uniref:GAF and ANTAR domain-containing protein n=1 Tax=Umezawaea beigongshangensis TaxID=2780383 RepID=UPI0018F1C37A|nr:GAF and ANTAR domain-containing protein [Umezawaea beigongshangensis]
MTDVPEHGGARLVTELQDLLLSTRDVDEFLQQVTVRAAAAVEAPVSCGITVRQDGRPVTVASSDDLATRVDEVQYGHERGPCLSTMRTGEVNLIEDLAGDDRWGGYRPEALARGVLSSLSVPLFVLDEPVGALNLYSRQAHSFGPREQAAGQRFAGEVSGVVALAARIAEHARRADDLTVALASRSTIDQALGVIMAQKRCSADEAFRVLRTASQNRNVKLRDIAVEVVTAVSGQRPVPHR